MIKKTNKLETPMSSLTSSIPTPYHSAWRTLAEFSLSSQSGSDQLIQEQVAVVVQGMNLSLSTMGRLKNAVAKAVLNATEHSHRYQADWPIFIRILILEQAIPVDGVGQANDLMLNIQPDPMSKVPEQLARPGWGFFLIHKLREAVPYLEEAHYSLELFLYQEDDVR
jgi:anti-sigma regulatory factor (Ser/Thr protein kinase)